MSNICLLYCALGWGETLGTDKVLKTFRGKFIELKKFHGLWTPL